MLNQRQLELAVHLIAGFAHLPAALRVAQDDVMAAKIAQHERRDLAGKGALVLEIHVLGAQADSAAREHRRYRCQRREWRAHHDLSRRLLDRAAHAFRQPHGLRDGGLSRSGMGGTGRARR